MAHSVGHVIKEISIARKRFKPFRSQHEGIAVIREEYLELEKAVFQHGTEVSMYEKAVQLAAMAICFAEECIALENQVPKKRIM